MKYVVIVFLLLLPLLLLSGAHAQNRGGLTDKDLEQFEEIVKKVKENANKTTLVEENRTADQINDTRRVLPPIEASSPVQFDTDRPSAKLPMTAKGQIAIDVIAYDHERDYWVPLTWHGAWHGWNYIGGSKSISIGGYGRDYFIVDCPSSLPYSVLVQNGGEPGYIELFISSSEENPEFVEHEKTYEPYGIILISGRCP